ncbi:hypothetical protein SARC_14367 [Sphaeroforma arctica JP610]|uniref:Uncharacterized protein n=1 Tax=Sphaeroforma arctica JP610 TaxID=667725 RepID=A0A0L0F8N1_9EUKA|nr:hypothetical protein SARC_14367 [Sphaeroforma arctica JP610]KNC73074.1 hypothetical protein SARC_14367 [Sphaeroforma arctica JP610]|eukprot:XP_014146976.1 hypothetical protein SARC_14367 [Sphaeroforma arctica JP610]
MLMGTGGLATAGKALQSLKWMVVNQTMEQRNGWDVLGDMLGTAYDNAEQQIADEQATATDNGTTTVGRRGLLEDVADALGSCASLSLNTISSEEMVSSYWSVYEMADKFLWGVWDGMSLTSQSQHSVGLSLGKILGESAGAVNLTTAVPTMLRAKYFVPGLADGMAATNNTFNDVAR